MEDTQVVQAEPTPAVVEEPPKEEPKIETPPPEEPEKPESRAEKRIKQLVAKQREAERDAEYWRGVAQGQKPPVVPQAPNVPKPEDFESYDDFIVAKAEHNYSVKQAQQKERETYESLNATFNERINKAAENDPEILEIVNDKTLPVSAPMAMSIKESDAAPEILKYLSEHRDESLKLSRMSPIAAAREIGKIEYKLTNVPKVETKKVSQAPEPIKPVEPKGPQVVDIEKISMDEYVKKRNVEQYGKRR